MKTAMQELIDEINLIKSYPMNPLIIKIATNLLEKEKEQIKNAYNDGYFGDAYKYKDWEEYYNQTYNQNK
jgi:hypothetical protein